MTGLFNTLNTATSGLRGQQTALQTVGHNLANTNTEGYSRQRVTMAAGIPNTAAGVGHIGSGVVISGITRIADDYVNDQLRDGNSILERYETTSEMLGQLELIYNEPSDTGLATQMTEVFNKWNYLAANPELATAKTMVVRQSETFVSTLNHMGNQMNTLAKDTERQIQQEVKNFNGLTKQLYDTNKQIFEATVQGNRPNDLLDQQDRILADLNNIVGVKIERDNYNRALVSVSTEGEDLELVTIDKSVEISYDILNATINVDIEANDTAIQVERGTIKGLQVALEVIEDKKADLETFANDFATAVNMIHAGGETDADNQFFNIAENETGLLSVNQKLVANPNLVNAGKDFGEEAIAGDGSRAKAIADLQMSGVGGVYDEASMRFVPGNGSVFSDKAQGSTLFNRYNDMVTDMGIEKQQADNMAANQTDLVALLDQRRESISGVDINEEVVNMIQYQSGFQANARMISVISEMLDTLINRTGV